MFFVTFFITKSWFQWACHKYHLVIFVCVITLKKSQKQLIERAAGKVEAEKIAAVAEQRAADMTEQLTEVRSALAEMKNESKTLSSQLTEEIQVLREACRDLEIKNAGLVASAKATQKQENPSADK